MSKYPEYTKEQIQEIVKRSYTFSDVCREMQRPPNSGNIRVIHRRLDALNIDYSHFKGRGWNKGVEVVSTTKIPIEQILVKDSTYQNTDRLRKRLVKEGYKTYRCEICGITEWLGKPLSLQLHHVNGINNDNRLENLLIICPNCHSQTENFGSKNVRMAE